MCGVTLCEFLQGDDLVELVDEMVAAALGNKNLGMYRIEREAYLPETDFLVKAHPVYRPAPSARHRAPVRVPDRKSVV